MREPDHFQDLRDAARDAEHDWMPDDLPSRADLADDAAADHADTDETLSRWELLRAAADILDEDGYVAEARNLRSMARHRASREAVIEQAARTMAADHNPGVAWTAMGYGQKSFIAGARALADAGLLVTEVPA